MCNTKIHNMIVNFKKFIYLQALHYRQVYQVDQDIHYHPVKYCQYFISTSTLKSETMYVSHAHLNTTTFQAYPFTIFTRLSIFTHGTLLANNTFILNDSSRCGAIYSGINICIQRSSKLKAKTDFVH